MKEKDKSEDYSNRTKMVIISQKYCEKDQKGEERGEIKETATKKQLNHAVFNEESIAHTV